MQGTVPESQFLWLWTWPTWDWSELEPGGARRVPRPGPAAAGGGHHARQDGVRGAGERVTGAASDYYCLGLVQLSENDFLERIQLEQLA